MNSHFYKSRTPTLGIAPTSLQLNSDLNLLALRNKVQILDDKNERNRRIYMNYIAQRRTKENIQHQMQVDQERIRNIVNHSYPQLLADIDRYNNQSFQGRYKDYQGRVSNISIIPHEKNEESALQSKHNAFEEMKQRQQAYFYNKQIEDNDYNRLPYIDYLIGRVDKVVPKPYNVNKSECYLGESTLEYNTILNPTNNYMHNKLLFENNKGRRRGNNGMISDIGLYVVNNNNSNNIFRK